MGSDKVADKSELKKKHSKKDSKKKASKDKIAASPVESSQSMPEAHAEKPAKKKKSKKEQPSEQAPQTAAAAPVEKQQDDKELTGAKDDAGSKDAKSNKTMKGKKRKAKAAAETKEKSVKRAATSAPDAITYLRLFHSDRSAWKFNKVHQTWLLKHMYDLDTIDDADFDTLVAYVKGLQGGARNRVLTQAYDMIPPETTDFDQAEFDAEAALASVSAPPEAAAATATANEEQDTPVVKRARAVARALA